MNRKVLSDDRSLGAPSKDFVSVGHMSRRGAKFFLAGLLVLLPSTNVPAQAPANHVRNCTVPVQTFERRRDDNKNKICGFEWGRERGGREENRPKRCSFLRGKRHENIKKLECAILLSVKTFCCHCAGA